MAELLLSIPELAKTPSWSEIKEAGVVAVEVGDQLHELKLVARPTKIGRLFNLVCPRCSARRRDLMIGDDGTIGCRGADCLRLRHPDQLLSPSARQVVRPARQIQRINARLEKPGLDRNLRRRLRRRRQASKRTG